MEIADIIRARLSPLAPATVNITDDSALHAGHAGALASGGGHFSVTVVSDAFKGQAPIRRHQAVYALLADLIPSRIHALQLRTLTPDES